MNFWLATIDSKYWSITWALCSYNFPMCKPLLMMVLPAGPLIHLQTHSSLRINLLVILIRRQWMQFQILLVVRYLKFLQFQSQIGESRHYNYAIQWCHRLMDLTEFMMLSICCRATRLFRLFIVILLHILNQDFIISNGWKFEMLWDQNNIFLVSLTFTIQEFNKLMHFSPDTWIIFS